MAVKTAHQIDAEAADWAARLDRGLLSAEDQAKACKQAFETGDDKAAMSAACRQGAGFR